MFLFVTNFFGVFCKYNRYDMYVKQCTLLEPYISENAKNDFLSFDGHYVVHNRGYVNYLQLGYLSPRTSAIIQSNEPVKKKNFKIDAYFTLTNTKKGGNGFGFWISSPLTLGGFYGRNKNFTGFGVVIATKGGSPYVEYIPSTGKRSKKVYLRNLNASQIITIEHQHPKLKVYYKSTRDNKRELVVDTMSPLEATHVFGVSGHTGETNGVMKIYSIMGTSIKGLQDTFKVENTQKSSPLVMFLGIIAILSLVYYLAKRQKKSEKLSG